MAAQLSFWIDDAPTKPLESEDAHETASQAEARRQAYDAWNEAFLRRYYTAKEAELLNSGNPTRLRIYLAWLHKQQRG